MKKLILFSFALCLGVFSCTKENPVNNNDDDKKWHVASVESSLIQVIVASQAHENWVYACTIDGVFKSVDNGASWSAVNTGLTTKDVTCCVIHPENPNFLFIGTWGKGVFKSENAGESWESVWNDEFDGRVPSIAISINNYDNLWAGTENGLLKSIDGGRTWERSKNSSVGYGRIKTIAVDPFINDIIYLGRDVLGTFKTTDGGASWTDINNFPKEYAFLPIPNHLEFDPINQNVLFMSTGYIDLFTTVDGGKEWTETADLLSDLSVTCLTINPQNSAEMWAGTEQHGVYQSTNSGVSWEPLNDGLDSNQIKSIKYHNGVLYAGTIGKGLYIYE